MVSRVTSFAPADGVADDVFVVGRSKRNGAGNESGHRDMMHILFVSAHETMEASVSSPPESVHCHESIFVPAKPTIIRIGSKRFSSLAEQKAHSPVTITSSRHGRLDLLLYALTTWPSVINWRTRPLSDF